MIILRPSAPEITAPEFLGYTFTGWTGTSATFANASSATTTVNVTAATTITAKYSAIPTVYFKNNLRWEHVYVTFDAYFGEAGGATVPGQNGKPYFDMTQMGESDIFSCVMHCGTNNSYAESFGLLPNHINPMVIYIPGYNLSSV